MAERPSDRVIEQRVRNRLIEYFELASSVAGQQEYERDAPIASPRASAPWVSIVTMPNYESHGAYGGRSRRQPLPASTRLPGVDQSGAECP